MTSFSQKKDSITSTNSQPDVSVITRKEEGTETDKSALNLIVGGAPMPSATHTHTPDTLLNERTPRNYPHPL